MQTKREMLANLRAMIQDVFRLRSEGGSHARLARAHGYVDGYMQVLLESGLANKGELLKLVAEEREAADGPAVGEVGSEIARVA